MWPLLLLLLIVEQWIVFASGQLFRLREDIL